METTEVLKGTYNILTMDKIIYGPGGCTAGCQRSGQAWQEEGFHHYRRTDSQGNRSSAKDKRYLR